MSKNKNMELTEGSKYKIISLGSREKTIETTGSFKGFINIGVDETGVLIELDESHGVLQSKIRIIPLHVILAIDVLEMKENQKSDDEKGMSHYVG